MAPGEKPCEQCGAPFAPKRPWARFCGTACRNDFHAAEARKQAMRAAAPEMYDALRLIAGDSCSRLTSGPGSCWSQPAWTKDAPFTADRWCDACIARAAIIDIKPPPA